MRRLALVLGLLAVLIGSLAAQASPPAAWVDSARTLPLVADGRVMPLETWAKTRGGLRDVLQATLAHSPGGLEMDTLLPRNLTAQTRETAAAIYLYWLTQSQAANWAEASLAVETLSQQLSSAHGSVPVAALEVFHSAMPWNWLLSILGLAGMLSLVFLRERHQTWNLLAPVAAVLVLSAWLTIRILVSGRPPVTSLPSTFLLVSWLSSTAALLLSFRRDQRLLAGLFLLVGTLLPWLTAFYQGGNDPFAPVQAVLNSNLWLGVHVTTIVAGYAGTLAAGLLGHAYLLVANGRGPGAQLSPLWKGLRLALLVGLVLTITGTLLGGVWADQSWGRFWGWDPKENGALLIVLWLALTLHLKPSGLAAEWGTALASALALTVLLFSWMGVNLLGQGLHAYGATPGKTAVFLGLLAADALLLSFLLVRRVLR